MGHKNGRIPSELLFELISALPFDIRWAVTRVSHAFDGFLWQKQFSWIKAELIRKMQKKSVFLQSLQSLSNSAKLLPEEIFEQNEVLFHDRIQYFHSMHKAIDRMAAKTTLGSGFPSDLGGLGTGTGTTFVQPHNYQFGTALLGSFHSSDDSLSVNMNCAMFAPEELTVSVVGNQIVVVGNHGEKQDSLGSIERRFVHKFSMPRNATADSVKSNLTSDGVLTVTASAPIAPKTKKSVFLQSLESLSNSAKLLPEEIFEQNEELFNYRIQYFHSVRKAIDRMAAKVAGAQHIGGDGAGGSGIGPTAPKQTRLASDESI